MTMQEQLRALVHRNHAKLLEQLAAVVRLLTQTDESGAVTHEAITEAESLTHQMKAPLARLDLRIWARRLRLSMRT